MRNNVMRRSETLRGALVVWLLSASFSAAAEDKRPTLKLDAPAPVQDVWVASEKTRPREIAAAESAENDARTLRNAVLIGKIRKGGSNSADDKGEWTFATKEAKAAKLQDAEQDVTDAAARHAQAKAPATLFGVPPLDVKGKPGSIGKVARVTVRRTLPDGRMIGRIFVEEWRRNPAPGGQGAVSRRFVEGPPAGFKLVVDSGASALLPAGGAELGKDVMLEAVVEVKAGERIETPDGESVYAWTLVPFDITPYLAD